MGKRRPNIILLVLDTQRADRMSIYGCQKHTTPAVGALAEQSTVFEWAIAAAPWTIPSHASMFTGVYPTVHQANQSYATLPERLPTLAELLRRNGYETVGFCNNPLVGLLDNGLKRGFNHFYNYSGTFPDVPDIGDPTVPRRVQRAATAYLQKILNPVERRFGRSPFLLKMALTPTIGPFLIRLLRFKGDTRRSIRDATDHLRYHDRTHPGKPLFLFINTMETHLPYCPPRDVIEKWVPYLKRDREARDFIRQFNTQSYRWMTPVSEPFNEIQRTVLRDMYDAEVAYQDRQLCDLFGHLERSGRLDNTMLIVTSDHGEGHGDHNLMGHAFSVYNEQVRVPLLIRYPEMFPAGHRVTHNVSTRRAFHTVLDAADIERETYEHSVKDLSLSRSVEGAHRELEDEVVVAEAYPSLNLVKVVEMSDPGAIETFRMRMMRRTIYYGQSKLITVGGQRDEFFNVRRDPYETQNLLSSPEGCGQDAVRLDQMLDGFIAAAEARRDGTIRGDQIDLGDKDEVRERLRGLGYID